jgi:hypothetical protein
VTDKDSEDEMKGIIASANSWCRRKMNKKQITKDMMQQLWKYDTALDEYFERHMLNRSMIMLRLSRALIT